MLILSKIKELLSQKFIWFYIIAVPVYTWWYVLRGSTVYSDSGAVRCLADIILWNGHYPKDIVAMLNGIFIIFYLRYDFRIAVLIKYTSKLKLVLRQFLGILKIAAFAAIYNTALVIIMGLSKVQYTCNWEKMNALPFAFIGQNVPEHLETYQYALILLYTIFFTVVMTGTVIIMFWWAFENPVVGFMLNLVWVILEAGSRIYVKFYYSVVDLDPTTVYIKGINKEMFIIPFIYIPILLAATVLIIKRKSYLRIK